MHGYIIKFANGIIENLLDLTILVTLNSTQGKLLKLVLVENKFDGKCIFESIYE